PPAAHRSPLAAGRKRKRTAVQRRGRGLRDPGGRGRLHRASSEGQRVLQLPTSTRPELLAVYPKELAGASRGRYCMYPRAQSRLLSFGTAKLVGAAPEPSVTPPTRGEIGMQRGQPGAPAKPRSRAGSKRLNATARNTGNVAGPFVRFTEKLEPSLLLPEKASWGTPLEPAQPLPNSC